MCYMVLGLNGDDAFPKPARRLGWNTGTALVLSGTGRDCLHKKRRKEKEKFNKRTLRLKAEKPEGWRDACFQPWEKEFGSSALGISVENPLFANSAEEVKLEENLIKEWKNYHAIWWTPRDTFYFSPKRKIHEDSICHGSSGVWLGRLVFVHGIFQTSPKCLLQCSHFHWCMGRCCSRR